jgi:hypothetical protein
MEDNSTPQAPALDQGTRRQLFTEFLQHAATIGAASVPLDLSDAELLEEVVRIRGNGLWSDSSTCQAPALGQSTRQQLFLELMKHATAVGAAFVLRELSDAELLNRVARIHRGAARGM